LVDETIERSQAICGFLDLFFGRLISPLLLQIREQCETILDLMAFLRLREAILTLGYSITPKYSMWARYSSTSI